MFNKPARVFKISGYKATRRSLSVKLKRECLIRPDKTQPASLLNVFTAEKHCTKSMSLGSLNKGSNCEGNILAYKKNKLCLISILYVKIINKECSIGL